MSQVYVKILPDKEEMFKEKTGKEAKVQIQRLEKKIAEVLIKQEVVELADVQREIEGQKVDLIPTDFSEENLAILKNPNLLNLLVDEVNKVAVGERNAIKTILLVCSLAKVKNKKSASANLCLNAQSGAGKDFITAATLDLFPEKIIFKRRRISERALDYALAQNQARDWSNYIIYLEDVSEGVLNADSIKTLLTASADKENTTTIVHEGSIKDLKIKGKPVFLFTTAKSKPREETLRRVPFCFMDESAEQTLKITELQAEEAKTGVINEIDSNFKGFFSGLNLVSVVIPYADEVQRKLALDWVSKNKRFQVILRTIFPRFLDYIKASAGLHQHQRQSNTEHILAQREDYENARIALLSTTSNKLLIPLNREQRELIETLENKFPDGGSVEMISEKFSKWGDRWLRIQLDILTDLGFISKEMITVDFSNKPIGSYKVEPGVLEFSMPSWEELFEQNSATTSNASINAIDSFDSKHEINSLSSTAINAIDDQMHQLNSTSENVNAGDQNASE